MTNAHAPAPSGLYHFLWRWHFYAGLFVAPFVVALALTGAIYLFNDDIEGLVYRHKLTVEASGVVLPASTQERAALSAFQGAEVTRYEAPITATRAAEWTLRKPDGRTVVVFVDPATAAITGSIDGPSRLSAILVGLHGELLSGRVGDMLVEFAGCWAFVLLVTGVFLWWPRAGRRVGVAAPRLSAKGRGFWRDLHAVPSAWNAPLIAFLILSGLPWSSFWGENLARLGTIDPLSAAMAPTPNFIAAPEAPLHAGHAQHQPQRLEDNPDAADLPWAIRQAALPTGGDLTRIGIDQAIAEAAARGLDREGLRVLYPAAPGGVFTLSFVPDKAEEQRTVHIDPESGAILQDISWAQYSPLGKAVEFGVETHVGRQFGAVNKWLMFASCLLLVLTVSFGIVMWWSRRPKGKLGVPPVPAGFRPAAPIIAAAAALGVVFPLVGASMLAILGVEALGRFLRRPQAAGRSL